MQISTFQLFYNIEQNFKIEIENKIVNYRQLQQLYWWDEEGFAIIFR